MVPSLGTTTYRSLHIQDTSMKSMVKELALQRKDFAKNALEFRDSAKGSTFRSRVQVLSGDEGRLTRECCFIILNSSLMKWCSVVFRVENCVHQFLHLVLRPFLNYQTLIL